MSRYKRGRSPPPLGHSNTSYFEAIVRCILAICSVLLAAFSLYVFLLTKELSALAPLMTSIIVVVGVVYRYYFPK
jgi:hypothetical protein